MALFPHQLMFTCSPLALFILLSFWGVAGSARGWVTKHDSVFYSSSFFASNFHWCCGNTCKMVNTGTFTKLLVFTVIGVCYFTCLFLFSILRGNKILWNPENQNHLSGSIQSISPSTVECMKSTDPILRQQCGLTGLEMRGIEWPGDMDPHPDLRSMWPWGDL